MEDCIMLRVSDFTKESYRTGEVAKLLGITPQTLRKYADDGLLKTYRVSDKGNRRVYRNDLIAFVKTLGLIDDSEEVKKVNVLYFTNTVKTATQCNIVMKHLDEIKEYVMIHSSDYKLATKSLDGLIASGVVRDVYICSVDMPVVEYATVKAICEMYNTKLIKLN